MAKYYEVLNMLIPNGGYVQVGDTYEGISFVDCEPITKADYEAGFDKYDAWKLQQDAAKSANKAAILERLGITEDEAKLLLG